MHSIKRALGYGLFVWFIPFAVAFALFPVRNDNRIFFESIMPVALTLAVMIFSVLYFKKVEKDFIKEGVWLGVVFMAVSLAIDFILFSQWPMTMPLRSYVQDIGFTYLLMPVATVGFGVLLDNKKKQAHSPCSHKESNKHRV